MITMKCSKCGEGTLRALLVPRVAEVGGVRYEGAIPARECPSCGESTVHSDDVFAFERGVAHHMATHGPASGETFRFMRRAIDLNAKTLAEIFDTNPETVSRWENGRVGLDPHTWMTLSSMVIDLMEGRTLTRDRLQALQAKRWAKGGRSRPRPPPATKKAHTA